jgi:O-antigen/teichoic acid export membrane protein
MNQFILKYKDNPKYLKLFDWVKLISITGGAQILIQAIGMVSGILIIRMLPTHEYALYTLANTMLGTLMMLTDSGISSGVMSQSGKVWEDKEKLGVVLATGLNLRRKFALVVIVIMTPFLLYILMTNGASWFTAILLSVSLIPAFTTSLSGALLAIPPKLHQDILPLQKNQIAANIGRLLMTAVSLFIFPFAFITILASGIPQIWANFNLRKISNKFASKGLKPDPIVRTEILKIVKKTFPGTVYFCLYSQINIWLISFFGTSDNVAQVGALSRLILVLGLFFVVYSTLVTPRFSKLPAKWDLLLKRFIQITIGIVIMDVMIITFVWFFPSEVLWILGDKYANLTKEIFLNVIGTCIGFIAGAYVGMYTSRGWVLNPVISISVSLLSIASGAYFFDLAHLQGLFLYDIYLVSIQVIMYLIYILYKFREMKLQSEHNHVIGE